MVAHMDPTFTSASGLEDATLSKRFTAQVVLTYLRDGNAKEKNLTRHASGFTWSEAREGLERIPWEDSLDDDDELDEVVITMLGWVAENDADAIEHLEPAPAPSAALF